MTDRNPYSMFLTAVDENKVFEVVKKCKSQESLDCNDIDMIVVIEAIIKPLTYICNLSFQTGRFPDRMKSYTSIQTTIWQQTPFHKLQACLFITSILKNS